MNSRLVSVLFACLILVLPVYRGNQLHAQSASEGIFIPSEIEAAYAKGTRSEDGRPGPNYWQNHARYAIDVRLEPAEKMIFGTETVNYINNSPDVLFQLYIRLQYDVYKKGSMRDESIIPENVSEGVQLDYLRVGGMDINLENGQQTSRQGTHLVVNLPTPLQPGDSLSLGIGWNSSIPYRGMRSGAYDSTSFFMGYWYPQVAVYDDIAGWDTESYTGQVEFYSDLADYDVHIHMPPNFMVHATGELQAPESVLPTGILTPYQDAMRSDEVFTLIDRARAETGFQGFGGEWHYVARNVPDFAFFTSDHYIWETSSVEIDGRRVRISTLYPPENAEAYLNVTEIQKKAMQWFSTEVSGIPYPYPAYASINAYGGGGMEFPMMANNAAPGDEWSMASLTAHEMHHMYFPFYVRINEKRYAWMDEGWADFITDLALDDIYGPDYAEYALSNLNQVLAGDRLSNRARMPLISPSTDLTDENYGYMTYMYAHYSYKNLHDLLGEETFKACFREYIRRWAYKSPTPYDFFNTFEDVSGQDLDWFWQPWYFSFANADVALEKMEGRDISVERKGDLPTSTLINITYEDGSTESLVESPAAWKNGNRKLDLRASGTKTISKVTVNAGEPDADDKDNLAFSPEAIRAMGDLQRFAGTYVVNPVISVEVSAGKDRLTFKVDQLDFEAGLFADGPATFSSMDGSVKVRFREDGNGNIGYLSANLFGSEVDARKEP